MVCFVVAFYHLNLKKKKEEGGGEEGVEQVLPTRRRSLKAAQGKKAKEPADQGVHDASHEHLMRHLQQLHLQRYQVQLQKGRCHRETYLGIQIFRFYFKCTKCSAELTVKTYLQNLDYVVESGATRCFELWRAEDEKADKMKWKGEAEEVGEAMKSLENSILDSKRVIDILAALNEMKSMKSRHESVTVDKMPEALQRTAAYVKRICDEDIETKEQSVQLSNGHGETSSYNPNWQKFSEDLPGKATDALTKASLDDSGKQENSHGSGGKLNPLVRISVIKKLVISDVRSPVEPEQKIKEEDNKTNTTSGLQYLCQNYGSDED